MQEQLKPVRWVSSSKRDLSAFPSDVQDVMGYALYLSQQGRKHPSSKPFKGSGGGVFEIVEDYDGNTYRAIYTVRFRDLVYVLHAFQKKSKKRIATPKHDVDLIKSRLKAAAADYAASH